MDVQPAHIDQVAQDESGGFVVISAESGGVAADLRGIDASLGVRLNTRTGVFTVFCTPNERDTYLVLTVQGFSNSFGVWEGLDQRVVERVRRIASADYDYVAEVERMNADAERGKETRREEKLGEAAQDAFKILRDGSGRNTRTASISKDVAA